MPIRINGSSGIDVDSIVKELMTARRVPLDKLSQDKQLVSWQRDSYREMNSKIVDFRNNKLAKYGLSASLNPQLAVVSGNTGAVKAEATASANGIPMNVDVAQLATKTSLETNGFTGNTFTSKSTLADVAAVSGAAGPYTLHVNGSDFSFDGSTSISTVISTINADSNAKVTAAFDEITGKLILSAKDFGSGGKVELTGDDNNNTLLKLFNGRKTATAQTGQDAVVFINDTKLVKSSNTFTVNGVQLTLQAVTNTKDVNGNPIAGGTQAQITTQVSPDKALETIKSFVSDYNDLLKTFHSKISEQRYRDFPPLTDDQRKAMNETDIKNWEDKAKSGLLKNDSILASTVSSMRSIIISHLGDLTTVGITTGQYYEGGKLYIDEAKLKQAIQSDPQKIVDLFQGPYGQTDQGIISQLSGTMNTALDKLVQKAGTSKYSADINAAFKEESVIGKQLKDYNKRILDMQQKLTDWETRYYNQFSAMERAMNQYNAQASSLNGFMSQ